MPFIQKPILLFSAVTVTVLGAFTLFERAGAVQTSKQVRNFNFSNTDTSYVPEVKIEIRDGNRYITSNGIPDHATGQFPNQNNPSRISPQKYHYRVTMTPTPASDARMSRGQAIGVAINGVPFDPGTAEFWNNNPQWTFEALSGYEVSQGSLGVDENFAHVQPNGAYHYHGLPMGLLKKLDYTHKMTLVGYAADGYPIYGPYAYADTNNPKSTLKVLKASYRLKDDMRPGGDGPSGAYDGSFAQDYEFVNGLGDLDQFNGRQGITPEYPQGTYYYVLTANWPFIPRHLKGTSDSSFAKGGPGGGPGGRRPMGGRPGGGPGGPGGPGPMDGPPPPFDGPPPPFGE